MSKIVIFAENQNFRLLKIEISLKNRYIEIEILPQSNQNVNPAGRKISLIYSIKN